MQSGWINSRRGKEGKPEKYQLKPQDSWGHGDLVSRLGTGAGAGELVVRNLVPKSTLLTLQDDVIVSVESRRERIPFDLQIYTPLHKSYWPAAPSLHKIPTLTSHRTRISIHMSKLCLGLTYVEGIGKIWQEILDLRVLSVCVPWAWGQEVKKRNGRAKKSCKIKVKEVNSALNSFSVLHSFWTTQENLQTED